MAGFGDHNQVRSRLSNRSSTGAEGFGKLRRAINETSLPARIPSNGPFMAEVLISYTKDFGPPRGDFLDYNLGPNSSLQRCPWIICRVKELHANIPDPRKYNKNGSVREQRLYWSAIALHKNVGICFPEDLDPDYHCPSPGEWVSVTFTNAGTFSGGRYKVVAPGDNRYVEPDMLRSRDLSSPSTPGLLVEYPVDAIGGPMVQPSFTEITTPLLEGTYDSPFPPNTSFEVLRDWGSPTATGQPYNGLDLMVLGPNGGLGTPVLTIGRARIKRIRCVDSSDRFLATGGVYSFESSLRSDSPIGRIITRNNYVQYAQLPAEPGVRKLPGSYRVYPPERGSLGYRGHRELSLVAHVEKTPEERLLMSRDTSPAVESAGSITGYTGRKQFKEMTIMEDKERAPTCNTSLGIYRGLPYGRVYYFTSNLGPGASGTVVEYELLEGPLQGETHRVRCMHLAAVSPALLSAWQESKRLRGANLVGLDVPRGTEIGLLGCQAVLDAPPHLHIDFGLNSLVDNGNDLDPACFMDLNGKEDYWCCSTPRERECSHHCAPQSAADNCYGTAGTSKCRN